MKKIIIINDLKRVLMKKRAILAQKKVRIFGAASAAEVLRIHRTEKADLIILDLDMRGTAGDKLIAAIREDHRLRTVPVMIICAKNKSAMERCRASGARAIVTRPVKPEVLFSWIIDLLKLSERESLRDIVKVAVKGKFLTDFFFAISQNVSASGILFETEKVFALGDRITCSFVLINKMTVDGEVVRIVKETSELYHYGVRFLALEPEAKAQLEEFVRDRKSL